MRQSQMIHVKLADIDLSESAAQVARRKHFAKAELDELVESIATHGVLQPVILRTKIRGAKYEMVAGERRFMAAGEADLEEIPAVVRELTDEQVIEVQLIENLQRKDLHPMQEAEGYQELMTKHGHPVEELHERVGKSRSYVYGRMKLLALSKKAREALYADKLSTSVALLIARIPGHKLQDQALRDLTDPDGHLSYRRAKQIVHDDYMLRLKGAPFPVDDPDLHKQAGPCNACPKRTGNQPELFGDIQSADVCTDPVCFNVKRREHGARQIKAAKAEGRPVVTGKEAKSAAPYPNSNYLHGYSRLDDTVYSLGGSKKVRSVVGKEADVALLQLPDTGEVVEVVKESVVQATLRKNKPKKPSSSQSSPEQKTKLEKKFRRALYDLVRPAMPPATLREIAEYTVWRMHYDRAAAICKLLGLEAPKRQYGGRDNGAALRKHLKEMSDKAIPSFFTDVLVAGELDANYGWNGDKPERLLAAAAAQGVDVKAVRRSVRPKKKAKKKAAKKRKKASPPVNCGHCGKPLTGKRAGAKYCDSLHAQLAKESRSKKAKKKGSKKKARKKSRDKAAS